VALGYNAAQRAKKARQHGHNKGNMPLRGFEKKGYSRSMPAVEREGQAVRQELERVLKSAVFVRNDRLSAFLRFVVEQSLEGRGGDLKESVIAVEVFGRKPDYNPKRDPIVRNEASRLRARLSQYYVEDGKADPLVIDLPRGGYVPIFREAERALTPARTIRTRNLLAAVLLVVIVVAAGWWWSNHRSAPIAIAVLPFINLSQDSANDYFADGLTSEIIRNLSIIDGLAVRSQTSSFVFKGKPRNVHEAGRQLAADYILEGSVLRAGRQLRINAQFVRVRDDFPVWSGKYDRELSDVFVIQDEIARGIVNSLRMKLGRGQRRYETSVDAYDFYLRARALEMLPALAGISRSVDPFEQAIAKDSSFAPAYAGLAAARAARTGFDEFNPDERASEMSKGWAAAQKAIQLDPLLAEAHDALGMMQAREAQWQQAEQSFRRAIELAPGDPLWHRHFAQFLLMTLGRVEEALRELRIAEKADPLSPGVHSSLRATLNWAGRFEEADADCRKMAVNDQQRSDCLAAVLSRQGKFDEVVRIQEARWLDHLLEPGAASLGVAYATAGRREDAERVAAIMPRPLSKATIFAALGDKDRTFEALDRAVPLGPIRIGRDVVMSPRFALLRGDPRLKELRRKVGLPE
jgi:serine/threonine-protein kinase